MSLKEEITERITEDFMSRMRTSTRYLDDVSGETKELLQAMWDMKSQAYYSLFHGCWGMSGNKSLEDLETISSFIGNLCDDADFSYDGSKIVSAQDYGRLCVADILEIIDLNEREAEELSPWYAKEMAVREEGPAARKEMIKATCDIRKRYDALRSVIALRSHHGAKAGWVRNPISDRLAIMMADRFPEKDPLYPESLKAPEFGDRIFRNREVFEWRVCFDEEY